MQLIKKYFPDLTDAQIERFSRLGPLYKYWNERVNVISRKDINNLYERHVLHSLSIACLIRFNKDTKIIDIGTGGGFPGIPLAIMFPDVHFHLIDSIRKKVMVVQRVVGELGLENVSTQQLRVEEIAGKFHFMVSRGVTDLATLYQWANRLIILESRNELSNGIICLKGGNIDSEINELGRKVSRYAVWDYFKEFFFSEKYVLHIPVGDN